MIKLIDISNKDNAKDVLSIQIPSYEVEAKIIDYYELPPLKDTIDKLQKCEEIFFGFYENTELCGAISLKADENVADIHRLIVHPNHFRKGIAQLLLNFVISKFNVKKVKVATGSKNTPAVNFYIKNGFNKIKGFKVNERLSLIFFEKEL
ncbi:GNAT family N-acetyltransferase [Solibacillus sp. CAU 1738]|uniref:GNAT family N-acetyltransferase n=1 Tax=Solibacillus sp. CAU 1738 TaxID=3140363 RepID=UPI00325FED96